MGKVRTLLGTVGLIGAVTTAGVAWAGPAAAHVEVSADNPQAGASDVTLTFMAESESNTEGIVSLAVVLPDGIAPADVSWVTGPDGWELTTDEVADQPGYTVAGPQVPAGTDAEYQVRIATLPTDTTELAFRTLQTYSDGHVDRWIELPQPGVELQEPAPVLELQPADATPTETASQPPATSPTPPPATSSAATPADNDSGSAAWPWIVLAALAVLAAAGGLLWWRRRAAGAG